MEMMEQILLLILWSETKSNECIFADVFKNGYIYIFIIIVNVFKGGAQITR